MITLSKEVSKSLAKGTITKEELSNIIIDEYSAKSIAESLAEFLLGEKEELSPIALDKEDYDRVVSLFRIRGQRIVDGQVIEETRGRKRIGE
jgi:hypothetical protein